MRNSFNTAGFSEVVHETRRDPAEAWFAYIGRARWSPNRGLSTRNGRAMMGTVKSVRRFAMDVADPFAAVVEDGVVTPMDLALTGVGSCSLKTMVGGGSARGVVFETLEVLISQGVTDSARSVHCQFEVDGSGDDRLLAELLDQVCRFSPNHRTLTEHVPLDLRYIDDSAEYHETPTDAEHVAHLPRPAARRIRWISGMQFESHPSAPSAGPVLRVDSPKQTTGVDWGPNPQEHILMGLAADIAAHLGAVTRERGAEPRTWEVTAETGMDVRGMLQADPSVPVQLQYIRCTVRAPGATAGAAPDLREIVRSAVERSAVRDLICLPQTVSVALAKPAPSAPSWTRGRTAS